MKTKLLLLFASILLGSNLTRGQIQLSVGQKYQCFLEDYANKSYDWVNISWSVSSGLYEEYSGTYVRTVSFHEYKSGTYSVTVNWTETDMSDPYDSFRHKSHTWYFTCKQDKVPVEEIKLNYSTLVLTTASVQLTATVYPNNATNKTVTWSSDKEQIVTVNSSGLVTPKSAGDAIITCKATDGSGVKATCKVTVSSPIAVEINATTFPDENFRKYLLEQDYGKDGVITESELSKINRFDVNKKGIHSLKGIECFTALTNLNCSSNQLTSLDVLKNTALTYLDCNNNQLTSLDVLKNTALTYLACSSNQLTSLDVSKNTALTTLACSSNQLTSLDVSKNTALTTLACSSNQLTSLDVSKNTALTKLFCGHNQLTYLDVLKNTALTYLDCDNNQLTSLDISKNTALTYFHCYSNQLTSLDLSKNTALTTLECYHNQLTSLDVSKNTALKSLPCSSNQLISLDVSKNTALTSLSCGFNQLTSLDVSKNTALTTLECYHNQLTSLDVSKNTALTTLECYHNQLTSLDVSKNTALTTLDCDQNQLTSLNVSKNTALTKLFCYDNQLTSLDLSKCTALKEVACHVNKIKGTAMDNLVKGLPKNTTTDERLFKVINSVNSREGNVCTASQVAVAKERGWRVLYWKNNPNEWVDYTGGSDYIKGDVNGDGQVNGTDLVALTNMILGKTNKTDAADVNGDGQVNGTDYVALVNIVLGRTNGSRTGNRAGDATAMLSIEPFDIKAGEEKEIVIDLTNPQDEITLVQFDLKLPSGLSIKKVGGEYDFDIADRTTWRKHSLDANDVEGGATRFLLSSSSNATLSGTEGAIIKITLKADNTFSSGDIKLENILLVSPSEKETKQPTYTYHVGESQPSTSEASLAAEAFSIKAGEEKELVIDLLNPKDEITLVQFDLRLPSGLALKQINGEYDIDIAGRTTWRKHSLDTNATDGIIRFLLSSSSNATLSGTEGAIIKMTLKADNSFASGTIKLENILLVTPDEKEIKPSAIEITTDGTGIQAVVMKESDNAIIYSISGQRLAAPKKGINIINGRKVIVK